MLVKKIIVALVKITSVFSCIAQQTPDIKEYRLTLKQADSPRFNGPKEIGVGSGSSILFRVPLTGIRPITFSASNLPVGLVQDQHTGIISGNIKKAGEYIVKLSVENTKGKATRFKIVVGGRLALTPPMGWNIWNILGYLVSEEKVNANADILVNSGFADHGCWYLNTDIGWEPCKVIPPGQLCRTGDITI